ncbi:hypothetical protein [Micromonospora aurantiaca (nom. illeg.)]|uniref:hypothetical protein n=1 Tax=Micromonospora aurantiaca (nom. illeg.) TaxID=47850 RepID=UPI00160C4AC3
MKTPDELARATVEAARVNRAGAVRAAIINRDGTLRAAKMNVAVVLGAALIAGTCAVVGTGVDGYFSVQAARVGPTSSPTSSVDEGYWYPINWPGSSGKAGWIHSDYVCVVGELRGGQLRLPDTPAACQEPGA